MKRLCMTLLSLVVFASGCTIFGTGETCELYEPQRVDEDFPVLRSD